MPARSDDNQTQQAPLNQLSLMGTLKRIAQDIKLSHTVFAMPFAVLSMVLAARYVERWPSLIELGLIVLCMFWARTAAMAMNRVTDAKIDADNPRTKGRAVPSGQVSLKAMLGVVIVCGGLFIACAGGFGLLGNIWPLVLSPFVLAWLLGYGYLKRVTWLCHVYLGIALAISPVAAVIAIEPSYLQQPTVWCLALMVACWVAGFDVIYALQDVACDQKQGLYSIPSRLGVNRSLWISRLLHLICIAALIACWQLDFILGIGFGVGVALAAALLVVEQVLVWRSGTGQIHLVFFTLNGVISLVLGGLGILDAVLLWLNS